MPHTANPADAHRADTGRRAVVTGYGVVSPIGLDAASFWASLIAGRSGVSRITRFDVGDLPVTIAGDVHGFDPGHYMPRQISRRLDRFAQFALAAATQAVEAAKLEVDDELAPRTAVLIGTGYGAGHVLQAATLALSRNGSGRISPFLAAVSSADNAAAQVALAIGARGPSAAVATACASGTSAVGDALRMIRVGDADVVVAGGADDPITPLDIAAAARAGALARRNDEPERASRPFDRGRTGFVMGAGAGVVVLEEAEHALRRGVRVLAEIAGYGATTDAHHITAPHPEGRGAAEAMRIALANATVRPDEIDYVNAHGTGTTLNDAIEGKAIKAVLGRHAADTPISSVKSMTGHLIGAAGAVELIATVQAIGAGLVPPTINCDEPEDPELDFVPWHARPHPIRTALSNSFGFGGHNAVLVVRRWPD